jgi:hypothetical protein
MSEQHTSHFITSHSVIVQDRLGKPSLLHVSMGVSLWYLVDKQIDMGGI